MSKFYGYMHWTLEEFPRCFYVGKGVLRRAHSNRSRNHKWHAVVKRFGLRVEVCVGPMTNEEACAWEIKQIARWGTFSTDHSHDSDNIGCNFTHGGDGSSGCVPSVETRRKMSESHMGNDGGRASLIGRPKSEAHKQAIRSALKGNARVSAALKGNQRTKGRKIPTDEITRRVETLRRNNARRKLLQILFARTS